MCCHQHHGCLKKRGRNLALVLLLDDEKAPNLLSFLKMKEGFIRNGDYFQVIDKKMATKHHFPLKNHSLLHRKSNA
jgi:hypothetical protein